MNVRLSRGARWATLAIAVLSFAGARGARAVADPSRVGFPSSDPVDGKFLAMPGKGMSSIVAPTHLSIGVPSSESGNLVVELFDGDCAGLWDKPGGATTTYQLFADPTRDGAAMVPIASATSASFADNAWTALYDGPQSGAATAPSGHRFYRLVVSIEGDAGVLNAYKVAVQGVAQISAVQNEFSVIGGVVQTGRAAGVAPYDQVMTSTDPMPSLDPMSPNPANTYDGTFSFKIYVGTAGAGVSLEEGDADHATDATAAVTREAALPSAPGVAADGADGNLLGGLLVDYRPFKVGGPIRYRVLSPSGATLATNTDPSGNSEYETLPTFDTSAVGFYTLEWSDVDMRNTFFLRPAYGVEVFAAGSAPVGAPLPTGLGAVRGVMFHDRNGNGIKDPREEGLAGVPVVVENVDTAQTYEVLTGENGEYAAGVPAGTYRCTSADGSQPDGALGTTVAGPTPVVTVQNGIVSPAASSGFADPTGADPELALVPECRGTLTHVGLDLVLPADLTGQFVQVQYRRAGTQSLYDAVSFAFTGRFSQPVLGFNKNLRVVNVYVQDGETHVIVDTTASSRGVVRRTLRAGDIEVLSGPADADSGSLRPICRPSYIKHGKVLNGGEATVKSLR